MVKRRSFEELKVLWDAFGSYEFENEEYEDLKAAFITKWSNVVMNRLYTEYPTSTTIYLGQQGEFMDGEYVVTECCDLHMYGNLSWSEIGQMCSYYLEKSPHWKYEVYQISAGVTEIEVAVEEEGFEDQMKVLVYLGYSEFEDLLHTDSGQEMLSKLYNLFEEAEYDDVASGDDFYILRTPLYKYAKQLMEVAKEEYPLEISYLKKAFSVVASFLQGEFYSAETNEYTYFVCTDGAGGSYPSCDMGSYCYEITMPIAAELIECIMFKLDKVYHILPWNILQKDLEVFG